MSINPVADVKPFKTMWKIKVKVIRLWKQYSAAGGETIEMVLCDVKGAKIHASVKRELVAKFDHFLRQGHSLMLINFVVTHSCGSYRTTNHAYRISFLSTTRVRPCEQLPESLSGFEPVKFKEVLDDIIGQIIKISHLEHVNVNGKETEKISLQLRNSDDDKLPVVLWGKFACDVNEAMQVRDEHCTILVLRFGKIKEWKEERSVSNAYNVSELGLNLPMIEVLKFTDSLPKDDLPLAIVESKYAAIANGVSDKDDFFTHTPRKTIAQMKETKQVEKCILMCTIAGIDSDMGWFYLSCKVCSKKVLTVPAVNDDDGNDDDDLKHTYYCVKCEAYNPVTVPRYKLHLVVLDNTSNTKLMVFDNLAVQLVNKPCLQIAGPSDKVEFEETNVLPPVLNTIIGKTCQ
ncbi:replication protein A 70 kDa DNA-binding subunit E-like [Brassica napus]|uniref:replication protein A 70 kDa DNA-binding subunit E-like n=1 Tax=Brassica napus TaxID=3708 RepID=UPI00207A9FE6|nr:replication protein A 70 kDa DNA-binding subunit E-like [Brassica napus]